MKQFTFKDKKKKNYIHTIEWFINNKFNRYHHHYY